MYLYVLLENVGKHPRVASRPEDTGRGEDPHRLPGFPPAASETSPQDLRAAFEGPARMTVGVEEELMLLDPITLDLKPCAVDVAGAAGDPRLKLELPASQLENMARPARTVGEVARELGEGRALAARAAVGIAVPAAAGAHPFAPPEGELNAGERYDAIAREHGVIARRQLICGLHVHVRVVGADEALAVYNAMRSYLPEVAALAANAPFHGGCDTGLASIRPAIAGQLPRQGVPPAFDSLEEFAEALGWGAAAGAVPDARSWWWELRPHPGFGTIEVRVADQQTTVAHSAAVAAFVHCLVARLADRAAAGERLPRHPAWRIQQNRWSAARHGLAGALADLDSGTPRPTAERVRALIDELAPVAARLGCERELEAADELAAAGGGAALQRAVAGADATRAAAWLAERFPADD